MTRLYFTDPIKALYMMKEFGVKLRNFTEKCLKEFEFEKDERIYIAKESEYIFKPKEGDIVSDGELFGELCSKSPYEDVSAFKIDDEGDTRVCKDNELRIIMRDDKQSFQAENETI